jgi:hypothetical protein
MNNNETFQTPPTSYSQKTSPLAIISLITGIASFFVIPLIGGITAIVTGIFAKREIKESNGRMTGIGMARAGLILGAVNIGLIVIAICIVGIIILFALGIVGRILF